MWCPTSVLEITVGHWPFSDQFQHLANQNLLFIGIHFQWDSSVIVYKISIL